ncbi:sensor histidine kinase [Geodermatophilus marinus]|uniref:sensor histidine kinase n=1 Tax=Geodermatophilus sp. LHW52908 TaxID=2303986 RepID=UPI000E3D4E80|nr:histidine kinase [Geodermatophilus sp. LHW52908]RFU20082.1 sensor histidine kinase [Geodermatophilus sp. LHW52908]
MEPRPRWRHRLGWTLPWLLFLAFPLSDLVSTPRPAGVRVVALLGLVAFTAAYLMVFDRMTSPCRPVPWRPLVAVGVLGAALAVGLGASWVGLLIYVATAAAAGLPERWVWPVVALATAVCTGVLAADGMLGELFFLPVLCVLSAFALRGTRYLISVNAELAEARDELARSAVAEERLRFARDLHDLLGHSLSMIALKSELAGRLAERDPARARAEMADVEAAARRALAEVREAVSGYRQIGVAVALAEARAALSAAGVALRAPSPLPVLPGPVDAVLGWVVREATTNVLRHSGARAVVVDVAVGDREAALTVTDDGRGPGGTPGTGLSGLAERVTALDGELQHGPAAGGGFRLAARVPLAAADRVGTP